MRLTVDLLGPPRVTLDGEERSRPRGAKTWALLAVLARSEVPLARTRVAELLFAEADDPLAALRWTASELRRLLGAADAVAGDPLVLDLPPGAQVDVDLVVRGDWAEVLELPGLGRPFLEGINPNTGAAFELWLDGERRRIEAATEAVLHEAASTMLARGEPDRAVEWAERLVGINPYEENYHAQLIRALVAAGRTGEADARVEAATRLLREELGVEPTRALAQAARVPEVAVRASAASLRAQLDAGRAALDAGVLDAGLETLRGVAAGASVAGDATVGLAAEAHLALGVGLVHAARGADEEAVTVLHQTLALAEQASDDAVAAAGLRELGYVEFLRGRYDRALAWLQRAREHAGGDDRELAWVDLFTGSCWSDQGRYTQGEVALRSAQERASGIGEDRSEMFAATHLGRLLLLRGEHDEAEEVLTGATAAVREAGWTAFLPYPEAYLAELWLLDDRVDEAEELFEHAFALGCQIGDVCWQTMSLRGLGLVADRRGDLEATLARLADAPTRCRQMPDAYIWAETYAQEALAAVAVRHAEPRAGIWVDKLDELASRHNLRDLSVRAQAHRAALGDPEALEVARLLADEVDNPALAGLLDETGRRFTVQ